ncbi:MAG TPA: ABC transporter permease [Vicinamibacterales bacterium]|nr:ABC transporter permease [Vicinamibacterales bacterium]
MSAVIRKVQYAVRVLWKSPTFTLTAVLCLGLGIGANTALFSIFNTLLWKPLPAVEPQALVRLFATSPTQGRLYLNFSLPEYEDYQRWNDVLAGLVATRGVQVGFRSAGSDAVRVFGEAVSDNYFEVLGLRARVGRLLVPRADETANVAPEVVLSHRFWQGRLQSDPGVVGRTVWLTGAAYTVVGIAPPGFNGTYPSPIFAPDFWLPMATVPLIEAGSQSMFEDRGNRSISLLGRMKRGVQLEQAQAALATIGARLQRSYPLSNSGVTPLVFRELDTHPEVYTSRSANLVAFLFLGLGALVLAVACANLANLMLARAAARRREIALRLALGAGRRHLVQQLVTEAIVLSLLAGGLGVGVAGAAARAISSVRLPTDLPIVFDVALDVRALWFTLGISLLAGVAFGLLPALGASRPDLVPALKDGDRAPGRRRRAFTLANTLVVGQVAVSLVLLVAAGLFWRSIAGSRTLDPGMQLDGRTLVSFDPSLLRYDAQRTATFYRTLMDRLRESPAVESAALAGWVPLGFQFQERGMVIHGDEGPADPGTRPGARTTMLVNVVSPQFFETVGVALRKGRAFTDQDADATAPVAIVNETLARRAWPGRDPIGRQLRADREGAPWLTVVGVVADGKYRSLKEAPQPCLFRPFSQVPSDALTLVVRTKGGHASALAAIRREVRALEPDMPLLDVKTMDQQMAKVRFLPQAMAALAGPAAGMAILIGAIGLYGVIACSVGRRAREFGIRLAIGAQAREVVRQVMWQGMSMVGIGLGLGLVAALALSQVMRRLLVGVTATDPVVFLGAVGLLVAIGALATFLPARRASRVDPLVALRQE